MSENMIVQPIIGKLIRFTNRWNPFDNEVFAIVKVDMQVINVPIDYRQQKYIQKEHPINSLVPIVFSDGKWQITSKTVTEQSVKDMNVFM